MKPSHSPLLYVVLFVATIFGASTALTETQTTTVTERDPSQTTTIRAEEPSRIRKVREGPRRTRPQTDISPFRDEVILGEEGFIATSQDDPCQELVDEMYPVSDICVDPDKALLQCRLLAREQGVDDSHCEETVKEQLERCKESPATKLHELALLCCQNYAMLPTAPQSVTQTTAIEDCEKQARESYIQCRVQAEQGNGDLEQCEFIFEEQRKTCRKLRITSDAVEETPQGDALIELVECCVEGKIAQAPQSAEEFENNRLVCNCQNNPVSPECLEGTCLSKAHHLSKIDQCLDAIQIEYNETERTASMVECWESPLPVTNGHPCGDERIAYDPKTKICCQTSQTVALCPCDTPLNVGTPYCGVGEWGFFQCLTPEQYDYWKSLGVAVTQIAPGEYVLTLQKTASECEMIQELVAGTYTFKDSQETESSLIACQIKFSACQCEGVPSEKTPEETPQVTPKEPGVVTAQPTPKASDTQICIGFAGNSIAICSDSPAVFHTDNDKPLIADYRNKAPVFASEVGGAANYEKYRYLLEEVWQPWEKGKISLAEAQQRMKEPAQFLLERFTENKTMQLQLKTLKVSKQAASSGGDVMASLGHLSREQVQIIKNVATGRKAFRVLPTSGIKPTPSFASALTANLDSEENQYNVVIPTALPGIYGGGGEGGCSLTLREHHVSHQSALLLLLALLVFALALVTTRVRIRVRHQRRR